MRPPNGTSSPRVSSPSVTRYTCGSAWISGKTTRTSTSPSLTAAADWQARSKTRQRATRMPLPFLSLSDPNELLRIILAVGFTDELRFAHAPIAQPFRVRPQPHHGFELIGDGPEVGFAPAHERLDCRHFGARGAGEPRAAVVDEREKHALRIGRERLRAAIGLTRHPR